MLKVKKLHKDAFLPTRSHDDDAGLDLYAFEDAYIFPHGGSEKVGTKIAIELPKMTVGLIWPRSKLSTQFKQLILGGVIDQNYRGEIMISLINHGTNPLQIKAGDKIAQLIIQPVLFPQVEEVKELSETVRGIKGINDRELRL